MGKAPKFEIVFPKTKSLWKSDWRAEKNPGHPEDGPMVLERPRF